MQLSHDEKVVFTSSKGFWRANNRGASSEGIATPQDRRGVVNAKRRCVCNCEDAGQRVCRQVVRCGTGLGVNAAIWRYMAADEDEDEDEDITIVGEECAAYRYKASGVRKEENKKRATDSWMHLLRSPCMTLLLKAKRL